MPNPLRDWDRFWFAPRPVRVLGLFRIAIGLVTLYSFALFAKDATAFFSDAGVVTADAVARTQIREFHTLLLWVRSPAGVWVVLLLLFGAGLGFTLGLFTRFHSILLFVLVVSFHERNNLVLNSGDTLLRNLLFFFMFAPAGAAWSLDALRRRPAGPGDADPAPVAAAPWAQRMMQVQLAVVYMDTVYAKTRGPLWHGGEALYYVFGLTDFHVRGVEQLMNYPILCAALTHATLAAELAVPFLLWFRATRLWACAIGVLLHGWTMTGMTLPVFGLLMLLCYIPFFTDEELEGLLSRLRARFAGARARVFFDGLCPLCRRTVRVVQALDLFKRVEFVDVRETPDEALPPGRARDALLAEMHLTAPGGRVLAGFDAFRWLCLRLPATFWISPLLWIPGVPGAGRHVYRWVAANRMGLVSCSGDASCPVHAAAGPTDRGRPATPGDA